MVEDRFMPYDVMIAVSRDLAAAGFAHVVGCHLIDPKWRAQYRRQWTAADEVMWTVRIHEYLTPMEQTEKLIEVCKKHGLTFWMGSRGEGEDMELYAKVGTPDSVAKNRL